MSSQKKHFERKPKKGGQKNRRATIDSGFGNLMQSALFGALIGLLSATLLLFAATAVCYATTDPASMTTPLALAVLYLSALIAGFAALRRHRSMALACGSLCGLFLMLVFLAVSLILGHRVEGGFSLPLSLLVRALMIPVSAIGGYLGLPKKPQRKRRAH